ncbi:Cubilin [Folsomia candida]|uniref:Cubilin n=1 Tax=Folsomia candida TaxID=158441 RepID=A0A226DQ01_FOLCA|nr:Cubilin [Folsomia candida]
MVTYNNLNRAIGDYTVGCCCCSLNIRMGKFTLLSVLTLHILTAEIFADEGYPGFPSPFPTGANKSYYLHAGNEGGKVFLHFDLLDLQGYSSSVRSRLTTPISLFNACHDKDGCEIHSKNYPSNYSNWALEQWIIEVPLTNLVLLDFKDFDTAPSDVVSIRNGNSADSPLEQSYSGNEIPPRYLSKSNKLFVSFITFGNGGGKGFFAKFVAYVPNPV